jgi:hypothetical protein
MKINVDNCFAIAGVLANTIKRAYEAISTQWRLPYDMETPEGQSRIAVEMVKEIYSSEYEKIEPFYCGYDDSEANLIYELSLWFVKYLSRIEKIDRNSKESITGATTELKLHILTLMGKELK